MKTSRKKSRLATCVAVIGALLILASGVYLYCDRKQRADTESLYRQFALLAEKTGNEKATEEEPSHLPEAAASGTEAPAVLPTATAASEEKASGPSVDFAALSQVNDDVVAWIRCEDTPIDYPVVQGADNSYYLKHLFDKRNSNTGCIFLDVQNEKDFSSQNSVLYGHHSDNDRMFASLVKYRKQAYYEEHPVMYLFTPGCDYRVELFAGLVVNPKSRTAPYYHISFADGEAFSKYVNQLKKSSDFSADVTVEETDRLLTLSTCTYEFYDARYVVIGKLVPVAVHGGQDAADRQ